MAHRVVWSRRAAQDLEAIAGYIAADSPAYAGIVIKRIVNLTKTLVRFPRSGRKVPEFDDDSIRELLVYSYRVIYRVEGSEVIIAAVVHGKRDLVV
jgi:addiction module RelE/StbE family toxin